MHKFHNDGTLPVRPGTIFVFGSNLAGRHGKGAALIAYKNFGAKYGIGYGRTGMSYAVPTKDEYLNPLPISKIQFWVNEFVEYARCKNDLRFFVTRIGCGLAGYEDAQIAPLFNVGQNCSYPEPWRTLLKQGSE